MFTSTNYVGCGHSISVFNQETWKNIKINNLRGTWSAFAHKNYEGKGRFFLCEHDKFGDEVGCIIVDENYNLIMSEVWNGFLDLEEYWDWENWEKEMFSVINERHMTPSTFDDGTTQENILYKVKFDGETYEVMYATTTVGNIIFPTVYYAGKRPVRYGVLEEKLKEYYNASK